jgi:hypothetical protein
MAGEGLSTAGQLLQLGLSTEAQTREQEAAAQKIGFENLLRENLLPIQAVQEAQKLNILRSDRVFGDQPGPGSGGGVDTQAAGEALQKSIDDAIDSGAIKTEQELQDFINQRKGEIDNLFKGGQLFLRRDSRGPASDLADEEAAQESTARQGEDALGLGLDLLNRAGVLSDAETKERASVLQGEIIKGKVGLEARFKRAAQTQSEKADLTKQFLQQVFDANKARFEAKQKKDTAKKGKDEGAEAAEKAIKAIRDLQAKNKQWVFRSVRDDILANVDAVITRGTQDQVNEAFDLIQRDISNKLNPAKAKAIFDSLGARAGKPPIARRNRAGQQKAVVKKAEEVTKKTTKDLDFTSISFAFSDAATAGKGLNFFNRSMQRLKKSKILKPDQLNKIEKRWRKSFEENDRKRKPQGKASGSF